MAAASRAVEPNTGHSGDSRHDTSFQQADGLRPPAAELQIRQASKAINLQSAPMSTTFRAALVYFAIVLGTGFVLGMFRVSILVPRIGERWAELAEMPIMAAVIFFAAGHILRRFPEIALPGRSLAAGLLALAFSIAAELGLSVLLQDQTLAEFIRSRDKISGSVYIALLLAFGIMPRLRLSSHSE